MNIIDLKNIKKVYGKGDAETVALKNIDLSIKKGEMIAIMGPSGSGKSTLLNIIGCIDTPTSGNYSLNGKEINNLNFNKLATIRNRNISFVFQEFALLKEFTVLDNVILPLNFRKMSSKEKKDSALKYLKKLQIEDLANKKVMNLSGGQKQRVAIARSLVQESELILADEPTGSLDQENGKNIMTILKNLNKSEGKTVIIVTHDMNIANYCDNVINMRDGLII